jgi:hypothetical protein
MVKQCIFIMSKPYIFQETVYKIYFKDVILMVVSVNNRLKLGVFPKFCSVNVDLLRRKMR